MPLKIIVGNVADIECDAIVNFYLGQFGQDSDISKQIHTLGGEALLAACQKVRHCPVGDSILMEAEGIPAKYIIHTVAPLKSEQFEHELALCYKTAFLRLESAGLSSIAYPLITSERFPISKEKAIKIALNRICVNFKRLNEDVFVYLVVSDVETYDVASAMACELLPSDYYTVEELCDAFSVGEPLFTEGNRLQKALIDNYIRNCGVITQKDIGAERYERWVSCTRKIYEHCVRLQQAEWNNLLELKALSNEGDFWDVIKFILHRMIGEVNGDCLHTVSDLVCLLVAYVMPNGSSKITEDDFRMKFERYLARQILEQRNKTRRSLSEEKADRKQIKKLKSCKVVPQKPNDIVIEPQPLLWAKDSVLYIYKGSIRCHRSDHNIIQATALFYGKADEEIRLNVEYCTECKKFFLNYVVYEEYRNRYGAIIGNLRMATNGSFDGQNFVAQESPLMLSGYNVNQRDGFTSRERHYILARFMHDGIMSKGDIIKYLTHFIQKNGKKKGNEIAVSKWRDDLAFVQSYNIHIQPRTIISDVRKY